MDKAGTTKYTYTAGGQLATEDGPWASDTVTNTYNNRLRTGLSLAQPTGQWANAFGYDAAKRLTSVTSAAGRFDYLLPSTRPSTLVTRLTLPNTSYITNTYDNVARLKGTYLKNSSHTVLNSHEYTYNRGNQRTQQVFNAGSTVNYSYDRIGQLKVADSATSSEDRGYVYDAAWNLNYRTNNTTLTTFTVNSKNQLTSSSAGYDGNGNLTNLSGPNFTAAVYDDENRPTTIQYAPYWYSDFVYDGLGRLRKRDDYSTYAHTYIGSTWYVYDGMRVISERNQNAQPTVSYTRGRDLSGSLEGAGGIGGLLARSDGYSAGNWSTHNYYHADGNGNVTYLVNSSQTLAAKYRYDPYGNTISMSGSLCGVNTYLYAHGNPVMMVDPSGHESLLSISATMGIMSFANNLELQGSHAILAKAEFLFGADDSTHNLITGLEFAMIGNDAVGKVSLGVAGVYGAFKTIGLLRSMSGYALRGAVSGWSSFQKRINAAKLGDLAAKAEVRCIKFLEGLGINVHVKDPVPGAPTGPLTADIIVGGQRGSGAGGMTADIFSPESATVQGVVDGIVAKAKEVQGGVVVVDLSRTPVTAEELGDIMAKVAALNEADRIKDVIIVPK